MSTLLMSYPGQVWSPPEAPEAPAAEIQYKALGEWMALCDHITRAGGRILVLDPPKGAQRAGAATDSYSDQVHASFLGAPFLHPNDGSEPVFLRQCGDTPMAGASTDAVAQAIRRAGLAVRGCQTRWRGQADLITLDRNRFLLTYGDPPGSSSKSAAAVRPLLPPGAHSLEVELRPSCAVGSGAVLHLMGAGQVGVLLAHRNSLASHTPEELGRFAGGKTEVFVLSEEDAAAHATEMVQVRNTLILPTGLSTILRGQLVRRGFSLVEVALPRLLGPGGGGPRRLVNELHGLVLSDEAPSYTLRRDELQDMHTRLGHIAKRM